MRDAISKMPGILALCASLSCAPAHTSGAAPTDEQPARPAPDVVELSAADARSRLGAGTLTSRALTQAYLDRIAAIDDAGPRLNAVIELNPDALAQAEALDAERKAARCAGPLHGIPVLLKDNIDVAGMVNSAGSLALADHRPRQDAFIVAPSARRRRRDPRQDQSQRVGQLPLHAIVVRLELARRPDEESLCARSQPVRIELGDGRRDCRQSRGDRHRHGDRWQHHLPGVGERPRRSQADGRAREPRTGIIPISVSQDTAGPMARTVADVALLLTAMAGVDAADPAGPAAEGQIADDYGVPASRRAEGQALRRAAAGDGLSPGRGRVRRRRPSKCSRPPGRRS